MITNKKNRKTHQMELILNEVRGRFDHPTADMIYESVKKKNKNVSKGTVYRNLNKLSDMNEISHIEIPGSDRFDSTLGNHYHIHCSKCDKVYDANIIYNKKIDNIISKKSGFTINGHSLVFEGLCPKCKNK